MEDTEPPSKRTKIGDDSISESVGFDEILEICSNFINKPQTNRSSSVKMESVDQDESSEDDVTHYSDDEENLESNDEQSLDTEDLMKMNIIDSFEALKNLLKKMLQQKDSDYFNLELQHDATLEKLEQYEENAEAAKKEINKNREVISKLEDQLQRKMMELKDKTEKIAKAEPILKDLAKNAKSDKAKIADLELKLIASDEKVKKREDVMKLYKSEIQKIIRKEDQTKQSIMMKENEIDALKNALASKDSRISQHSEDNLKKMIDLQETINTKDMEITKLQFKNSELTKSIEDSKAKSSNFFVLDNDNPESNHLENLLEDKEKELKNVNEENNELLEILNKKEDEIKRLEYQNMEKLSDNKKLKSSVDKLLDKLDLNKKELDTIKRSYRSHFEALNSKYEKFVSAKQKNLNQPQIPLNNLPPKTNLTTRPSSPLVNFTKQLPLAQNMLSQPLNMMKPPHQPLNTPPPQPLNTPSDIKKRLSNLSHLNISQKMSLPPSSALFPSSPFPQMPTLVRQVPMSISSGLPSPGMPPTPVKPASLSLSPPGPHLPDLVSNTHLITKSSSISSSPNTSSLLSTDDEDSLPSLAEQTRLPSEIPLLSGQLF